MDKHKLTRETTIIQQTLSSRERTDLVESAFSLLRAKESNLQVAELTRKQTNDKPALGISAYQAM